MAYIKEFKKGEDISKYSSAKDLLLDHYGEDFYNWLEIQMKELSPVAGKENWRLLNDLNSYAPDKIGLCTEAFLKSWYKGYLKDKKAMTI